MQWFIIWFYVCVNAVKIYSSDLADGEQILVAKNNEIFQQYPDENNIIQISLEKNDDNKQYISWPNIRKAKVGNDKIKLISKNSNTKSRTENFTIQPRENKNVTIDPRNYTTISIEPRIIQILRVNEKERGNCTKDSKANDVINDLKGEQSFTIQPRNNFTKEPRLPSNYTIEPRKILELKNDEGSLENFSIEPRVFNIEPKNVQFLNDKIKSITENYDTETKPENFVIQPRANKKYRIISIESRIVQILKTKANVKENCTKVPKTKENFTIEPRDENFSIEPRETGNFTIEPKEGSIVIIESKGEQSYTIEPRNNFTKEPRLPSSFTIEPRKIVELKINKINLENYTIEPRVFNIEHKNVHLLNNKVKSIPENYDAETRPENFTIHPRENKNFTIQPRKYRIISSESRMVQILKTKSNAKRNCTKVPKTNENFTIEPRDRNFSIEPRETGNFTIEPKEGSIVIIESKGEQSYTIEPRNNFTKEPRLPSSFTIEPRKIVELKINKINLENYTIEPRVFNIEHKNVHLLNDKVKSIPENYDAETRPENFTIHPRENKNFTIQPRKYRIISSESRMVQILKTKSNAKRNCTKVPKTNENFTIEPRDENFSIEPRETGNFTIEPKEGSIVIIESKGEQSYTIEPRNNFTKEPRKIVELKNNKIDLENFTIEPRVFNIEHKNVHLLNNKVKSIPENYDTETRPENFTIHPRENKNFTIHPRKYRIISSESRMVQILKTKSNAKHNCTKVPKTNENFTIEPRDENFSIEPRETGNFAIEPKEGSNVIIESKDEQSFTIEPRNNFTKEPRLPSSFTIEPRKIVELKINKINLENFTIEPRVFNIEHKNVHLLNDKVKSIPENYDAETRPQNFTIHPRENKNFTIQPRKYRIISSESRMVQILKTKSNAKRNCTKVPKTNENFTIEPRDENFSIEPRETGNFTIEPKEGSIVIIESKGEQSYTIEPRNNFTKEPRKIVELKNNKIDLENFTIEPRVFNIEHKNVHFLNDKVKLIPENYDTETKPENFTIHPRENKNFTIHPRKYRIISSESRMVQILKTKSNAKHNCTKVPKTNTNFTIEPRNENFSIEPRETGNFTIEPKEGSNVIIESKGEQSFTIQPRNNFAKEPRLTNYTIEPRNIVEFKKNKSSLENFTTDPRVFNVEPKIVQFLNDKDKSIPENYDIYTRPEYFTIQPINNKYFTIQPRKYRIISIKSGIVQISKIKANEKANCTKVPKTNENITAKPGLEKKSKIKRNPSKDFRISEYEDFESNKRHDFPIDSNNVKFFNKQLNQTCQCGMKPLSRIVGGAYATEKEYPWMVVVCKGSPCNNTNQFCAATLINDRYCLTAAHCIQGMKVKQLSLGLGNYNTVTVNETNSIEFKVKKIIIHENYLPGSEQNDIALLKLKGVVKINDFIRPICLPSPKVQYGTQLATVTGWGTETPGGNSSETLKEVDVKIVPNEQCKKLYSPTAIQESMLCAGSEGKDSCQGDSGGPLNLKVGERFEQIGIVSWGYGCGSPGYPGVYTRVRSFLSWINERTTDAVSCT